MTAVIVFPLLMTLFACTSGDKAAPGPAGSPNAASAGSTQGISDKDMMIKILPETPTVLTDLQVILSGMENVTYQWEKNNEIISGENTDWLPKRQFAKDDRITVKAMAGTRTISASTVIVNSRPKVTGISINPQPIYRGTDITATPSGYDADNDFVRFSYRWLINDKESSQRGETLRGDAFKRGDVVVLEVVAYDNEGEGEASSTVPLVIPNASPKFVSFLLGEHVSNTYTYQVKAEDPDGDVITYTLTNPPKGMAIDASTGQITWQITAKEDAGTREVEIVAQDELGLKATQKYTVEVTIPDEGQK